MKHLFFLTIVAIHTFTFAQSDAAKLQRLFHNDSSSAQLLLGYPDSIYTAVLTAAQYPEALARLHTVQNSTSLSFQNLMGKYGSERQKQLWNISRYAELPAMIIENKGKKRSELSRTFSKYDQKTKNAAIHFARKDNNAIVQMRDIQKQFNQQYHEVTKDYPPNVRSSFNLLLRYPELASVFSRDSATTKSLGELYRNNPALVKHVLDSSAKQMTKDYSKEFEDWRYGISTNPKVAKDMKNLSREYKKQEKNVEDDDVYANGSEETVTPEERNYYTNSYYVNPYPYWAGYPSWYATPYWYPYPWWWSAGFSWYPQGSFYFYGLPTYNFGHWYYYHPRNYYARYPHAGNYFYQHYQQYPRSNSGINNAVRNWHGNRVGGSFPGGRMGGGGFSGGGMGGGGFGGRRR
jgi:hypothetical protein